MIPSSSILVPWNRWLVATLFLTACLQSKHEGSAGAKVVPGGTIRLLEEHPGRGRLVAAGDRIRVEMTGRYANGQVWGKGPLTLVVGDSTYPGTVNPLRVGSVIRLQYVVNPNDTITRLMPFQGGDAENEAYQVRRDRGQVTVEHKIVADCRPMKLFLVQTGYGPFEFDLGCWGIRRSAPPRVNTRVAELERRIREMDSGEQSVEANGVPVDPPIVRRREADTARYLGPDGLHRAAREGRPDVVGWLLARDRDARTLDSVGFEPIHYVGYAQHPAERFVPAFEQSYLDVVDSLVGHGARVDAQVQHGAPRGATMSADQDLGATALDFAATHCADRLVAHLLQLGANPNVYPASGQTPLIGAAINGCPEVVKMLLARGARVDEQPQGGGTPVERLASVSAFHEGHYECARLLVQAGASTGIARERLKARLDDAGPGGFGFSNRPMARKILQLLR